MNMMFLLKGITCMFYIVILALFCLFSKQLRVTQLLF